MPGDPTLSVILPVRNVEAYLSDMLISLERNADVDLQVICLDDGSVDATPAVIAEFAARLPWLQTFRHDDALGLASARNAGLDAARGRYVTFLDGDDWIAPGYLARLVAAVDTLGTDFVRVDHVQVHDADRLVHHAPEARRGVVLDAASGILPESRRTMVDYPYAWAGVYRRDLGPLLRFPDGLHTAEDRPWIWRLHREAATYAVVSLAGVFYRRLVANSLTQIGDERQLHFLDAYAHVLAGVAGRRDYEVKAVRQFLAIVARQLELSEERFTPELRRTLAERSAAAIGALDPELLATALPKGPRRDRLAPVLPPALRVRRAVLR